MTGWILNVGQRLDCKVLYQGFYFVILLIYLPALASFATKLDRKGAGVQETGNCLVFLDIADFSSQCKSHSWNENDLRTFWPSRLGHCRN